MTVPPMTSISSIYIAQTVGSSRVMYAMGREGSIPRALGKLNRRHGLPWNAMTVGIILTTVVTLVLGKILGLANQYAWTGTMSSFLGLLTYFCVNAANIIFYLRHRRDRFNILLNGVVPVIGIAVVIYILYQSCLAVGAVIEEELRKHVEYFCVATRNGDRDDLAVLLERPREVASESLQADLAEVIRQRIGTRVDLRVVAEDSLAGLTGRGEVTKLRRYMDARGRQQLPDDVARHLGAR